GLVHGSLHDAPLCVPPARLKCRHARLSRGKKGGKPTLSRYTSEAPAASFAFSGQAGLRAYERSAHGSLRSVAPSREPAVKTCARSGSGARERAGGRGLTRSPLRGQRRNRRIAPPHRLPVHPEKGLSGFT